MYTAEKKIRKQFLKGGNVNLKLKNILIVFIVIIMIPISSHAITQSDNGKIQVLPVYENINFEGRWIKGFDIRGIITKDRENTEKQLISTTHNNLGFHVFLNVNGKHGEMNGEYTLGKENMQGMHYSEVRDDTVQNIDGIDLLVTTKFINEGKQLQINYMLNNTTNSPVTFSLGTAADIEIDGDDEATIEKMNNGEMVKLWTKNGETHKEVQFVFYGKNTKGVTNIDNLWIGGWSDYYLKNIFNTNPNVNKIENYDSALTYSWVNRTIKEGEEQKYSVILEVGENNVPEIEVQNNTKLYALNAVIEGTVLDKDLKDTVTIHYTINGVDYTLPPINTTGTPKNFSLDLTKLNLTVGTPHTLKLWATDNTNCKSNVKESAFIITYLKNPQLTLSEEEWTKNDVLFKITDTENIPQYVNKYQYRINSSEWFDFEKEVDNVIDENGENKIEVRILGKEAEDISGIITKYAKIDKINPTTEKPTATKTINSITIDIQQKDEYSGIDSQKTLYAIKQGTKWSEWQTSNTFINLKENTTYTVKTQATDNVGNTSESEELIVITDEIEEKEEDKKETHNNGTEEKELDKEEKDNNQTEEKEANKEQIEMENKEIDNTTSKNKLPQTGENNFIQISITFLSIIAVYSYYKLRIIEKNP